eukprot:Seg2153.1 transcript_id=Seg2153.1/GoldUCD/mRNA.D3Y31 product="hypothetical protein" protein_id=Seg2153.1/GoldUCD/D3Y31
MKFTIPAKKGKHSSPDADKKDEVPTSPRRSPTSKAASLFRRRNDPNRKDSKSKDETGSEGTGRKQSASKLPSPDTSPMKTLSVHGAATNGLASPSISPPASPIASPKQSISSIMASMKKASAWSEIATTSIKVPTVARVVWLATKGKWPALDQLLDKMFLDSSTKIDLRVDPSMLGVSLSYKIFVSV